MRKCWRVGSWYYRHVKCFCGERSVLPVYGDEYYGGVI
jgi:hypothetical protein